MLRIAMSRARHRASSPRHASIASTPRVARLCSGESRAVEEVPWSSAEPSAREQEEIGREDRGAHVRVKAGRALPHAARKAEDALQERDAGLDPGAEATQLVIDPLAPRHLADEKAALLGEADISDAKRFHRAANPSQRSKSCREPT